MRGRIRHGLPGELFGRGIFTSLVLSLFLALGGCGYYIFTGATIHAHLNQI